MGAVSVKKKKKKVEGGIGVRKKKVWYKVETESRGHEMRVDGEEGEEEE